jgi:aminopeptidase N
MSTYLVALVVADYECIDNQIDMPVSKTKLSSSTCARSNAVNQINLASNSSISLVQYFEKYFDTTYPFPKLDHIGSPDFAYGKMFNIFILFIIFILFLKFNRCHGKLGSVKIYFYFYF